MCSSEKETSHEKLVCKPQMTSRKKETLIPVCRQKGNRRKILDEPILHAVHPKAVSTQADLGKHWGEERTVLLLL